MHTCDNCKVDFEASKGGVTVSARGLSAAAVCDACMEGARKIKLVLTRKEIGGFTYEQYTAIEMVKKAG